MQINPQGRDRLNADTGPSHEVRFADCCQHTTNAVQVLNKAQIAFLSSGLQIGWHPAFSERRASACRHDITVWHQSHLSVPTSAPPIPAVAIDWMWY